MTPNEEYFRIIERIPPRSILYLTNGIIRIESHKPIPNAWIRFWHRVLLDWRWEEVKAEEKK